MNLESIELDPFSAFMQMERYVNDGSKSGFSFSHTTSENTSPLGVKEPFHLLIGKSKEDVTVIDLGEWSETSDDLILSKNNAILAHPDMATNLAFAELIEVPPALSKFRVLPTSSGRTVCIMDTISKGFVKLHYDGTIGRNERNISLQHAQAAIEANETLKQYINSTSSPSSFGVFSESFARVLHKDIGSRVIEWGVVWRDISPLVKQGLHVDYLIPGFSLFSRDKLNANHQSLLAQLYKLHKHRFGEFLHDQVLLPLVDGYFSMLIELGLQGEWHAQNVVFGFDKSWNCVVTLLRDFASIDRDLTLMEAAGRPNNLPSYPYKCIDASQPNYSIRHSFMFDHKLGEYLLKPIIDHCSEHLMVDYDDVIDVVRKRVSRYVKKLPRDFFPDDGCWYKFPNIQIVRDGATRPYIPIDSPPFR